MCLNKLVEEKNRLLKFLAVGLHLLFAILISFNQVVDLDKQNYEWVLFCFDLSVFIVSKHEQSESRQEKIE